MRMRAWNAVLALAAAVVLGCSGSQAQDTDVRAKYRREIEDRLRWADQQIDTLAADGSRWAAEHGREVGEDARRRWNEQIARVRGQRDSLRTRVERIGATGVDRIQTTGTEAWEDVKAGTDRMLARLEQSIHDARQALESRADTTSARSR